MAIATQGTASNYLQRAPSPSGLADVVDLILDKGLVIDAYVRVAVIGIELITIDARIVIASVDTYLRFAEAVNRLDLNQTEKAGIDELRGDGSRQRGGDARPARDPPRSPGVLARARERARIEPGPAASLRDRLPRPRVGDHGAPRPAPGRARVVALAARGARRAPRQGVPG